MHCSHDGLVGPRPARRMALAIVAIAMTALVMHVPLSYALVQRGDDLLYQGNATRALAFYARALVFDADNAVAVDRYAFVAMTLRGRPALRHAINMADRLLESDAANAVVRMDRALCEWKLDAAQQAEVDFARVARERRDARAYVFAGYAALRAGNRRQAVLWWKNALRLRASYEPAERALRRL
jgi:tetratricopeptide (TPR) repeat protein